MKSIREIAAVLGISPNTAEIHLTNALRKIRRRQRMKDFVRLIALTHAAQESRKETQCLGH